MNAEEASLGKEEKKAGKEVSGTGREGRPPDVETPRERGVSVGVARRRAVPEAERRVSVLLVVALGLVVLECRLHAGLGRMLGTGCDFLAAMLLFLLHFFVVRDIAWISHAPEGAVATACAGWDGTPRGGARGRRRATAFRPSWCQTDMMETDFVTR